MEAFEEFGAYNTFIVGRSHNFFNIGMVEIISALIENEIIIFVLPLFEFLKYFLVDGL